MNLLKDNWTLYIHLPTDINWALNSYKKITTFNKLEDCISLLEYMNKDLVTKCMLFIMKNNIKPIWEDVNNAQGGCFSYKISNDIVHSVWKKICYLLICNTLIEDDEILDNINGISISPKKNFCIIKLWFNNVKNLQNNKIFSNLLNENKIEEKKEEKEEEQEKEKEEEQEKEKEEEKEEEEEECELYDPFKINEICDIEKHLCIFKQHKLLY